MRMLRHHVVDLNVTGKGCHHCLQIESQICGIVAVQCGSSSRALGGYKSASWSVLSDNFRPLIYLSRVVTMAWAVIQGWHCFQLDCSYR